VTLGDLGTTFSDFRGYRDRDRGRDRGRDRDRAPLDHPRLRPYTKGVVESLVQGGSKQVTYKHYCCKIQAIKLSYCKIQD